MNNLENLVSSIDKARNDYYNGLSSITDDEYDFLVEKLRKLDPSNKLLKEVGIAPNSAWEKVKHEVPMGSLNKASDPNEFQSWINKHNAKKYLLTLKLDGLSVDLKYINGKLVLGATRGDGDIGEDITKNILKIPSVPNNISYKDEIHIRGEIILKKSVHKLKFPDYSNPRNAASGLVRRLDGESVENLSVIVYSVEGPSFEKESEVFLFLEKLGFEVPVFYILSASDVLLKHTEYENSLRDKLDFDIDGLVVRIEDRSHQFSLGETNKRPEGCIAFKFKAAEAITTCRNMIWQVGNSGRITPVAIFDEVNLVGAKVERASLYNYSYIQSLKLDIGSTIIVKRANDVIPRVDSVINSTGTAKAPTHCPDCNTEVKISGEYIMCPNTKTCPAQVLGRISRWISENGILEWGDKVCQKLIDAGLVSDIADIYKLKSSDIASIDRMGQKSADNLIAELNKHKEVPLQHIIGSLGIENVGTTVTKLIMDAGYDTLEKMYLLKENQIANIMGIGPIKAHNFFYGLKEHQSRIKDILDAGVVVKQVIQGNLNGKSFCFTGKSSMPRAKLHAMVEENGGTVKKSVAKGLDYLVSSGDDTTKASAAKKYGTKIISEDDFLEMLKL